MLTISVEYSRERRAQARLQDIFPISVCFGPGDGENQDVGGNEGTPRRQDNYNSVSGEDVFHTVRSSLRLNVGERLVSHLTLRIVEISSSCAHGLYSK